MPMNTLLVERTDGIATVSFNRPNVLNAMSLEMASDLSQLIEEFEHASTVRVVIFTGAPTSRSFRRSPHWKRSSFRVGTSRFSLASSGCLNRPSRP